MNCVYVKLSPYLAEYWYKKRNIPKGQPLTLPDKEFMEIVCSSLKRNPTLQRNPGRNKKGYLKDTICYCRNAYEFTMSKDQPPLIFNGEKIPTKDECKSLYPFLIPDKVPSSGKDKSTDGFYELKAGSGEFPLRGYSGIRKYIITEFYHDLNKHVHEASFQYVREHKNFNARAVITDFLAMYEIGDDNYETIRVEAYQHTDIKSLKAQAKGSGDIDSISRTFYSRKSSGQIL